MKKLIFLFYILMVLFKTGNVLSDNSIFSVNNIQIDKKLYKNADNFLNKAFEKGFKKLAKRILLNKDYIKISNTNLQEIKSLVSYYQIINKTNNEKNKNFVNVNLKFDREKLNKFFYKKNILYSDLNRSEVIIFPLHVKNESIFIFDKNYFFNNWLNKKKDEEKEQIEYLLPVANLEIIELINNNVDKVETINIRKIFEEYRIDNNFFVIIFENEINFSFFIKGSISAQEVVKNFKYLKKNLNQDATYNEVIKLLKKDILEIIKSKNLIDIKTPSFLNLNLSINNKNDLFKTREILKEIDLIEKYNVLELTKDYVKIKIKYYGKIGKISEKLKEKKIILNNLDNIWTIELL